MFFDFLRALDKEIEAEKNFQNRLRMRIRKVGNIEDEHLVVNKKGGKLYYYLSQYVDGKEKRTYMDKNETEHRMEIQERYYLDRALRNCYINIDLLETVKRDIEPLFPNEVMQNLPAAYKEQLNANKYIVGYSSPSKWKQEKLKIKNNYQPYMPEELRHIAADGTKTRTKSEALIINLLNEKNIPYIYELPMKFGNKLKLPDFLIFDRKSGKEIMIEHMGRMDLESYRDNQYDKLGLYISNGFTPNVNLLLTFDDASGNIDLPAISKMIDAIIS